MPQNKLLKSLQILVAVLIFWALLTAWVQFTGQFKTIVIDSQSNKTACIFFNPDPIYNLDEQVCLAMADELKHHGFTTTIMNSSTFSEQSNNFDMYVACANTYNFAPDWSTTFAVKHIPPGSRVIALTLGSGSTSRAHGILTHAVIKTPCSMVGDGELWLMRPNDEERLEESNSSVAGDNARRLIRKSLLSID
ncbi:MAG: hypothetical protein H6608_12725 [Flavobacteriales bacterium]|nr:hypothetical protein [Bacteroidota bacterium]MCB9241997.1 hypothetical protein [Flavobacteriales bacterium]